jgi:hypothetical protein
VGRKLRIWDKDEARWQAGKVTAEKAAGLVRVCYDSGEEEELELGSAKYEWVEDTKKPSADTNTKKKPTKRAVRLRALQTLSFVFILSSKDCSNFSHPSSSANCLGVTRLWSRNLMKRWMIGTWVA